MYSLYLDDERFPKTKAPVGEWVICRTMEEAVDHITINGWPKYVSFDHDLGDDEMSGYAFCKWLTFKDMNNSWMTSDFQFNVHSANPVGAENIRSYLTNYIHYKFDY